MTLRPDLSPSAIRKLAAADPARLRALFPDVPELLLAALREEAAEPPHVRVRNDGRKQAEEALRKSESRFRRIFEHAALGIAIEGWDGRFQECNPAFCALLGYTREELQGTDFVALLHPVDREASLGETRRMKAGEIPSFENESRFVRKDGQAVWVHKFVCPLPEEPSGPHVMVMVTDITARRRAEDALRRSERRYRSFVDVTSQFAWVTDPAGRVAEDIPAVRAFTGQTYEEARGEGWAAALHSEDRGRALEAWHRAVEAKAPYEVEYRMRRHDGVYRLLLARGVPILDGRGEVTEWVGTCIDVSERKRAEEALRESERRLRLAQQAARVGAFEWNIATGVNVWTEELEAMYGLAPGRFERTQPAWESLVHPDDRDSAFAGVREALATGNPVEGEWRVVWPDGSVHWILGRFQASRDSDGRPLRLVGANIDITARKEAEKQITAAYGQVRELAGRLQSIREEERTRISREIHDELAQNLTALRLGLIAVGRQLDPGADSVPEALRESVGLVESTLGSVRRIASDLRPAVLDALGLGAALKWQAEEFSRRTGIRCTVELETDPPTMDGERSTAIFRIFQEALSNVARHAVAAEARATFRSEAGTLCLRVEDDGRGLRERPDSDHRGLGILGMQERAAGFGGTVEVSDREGRGTAVLARIPLAQAKGSGRRRRTG